MNKVFKNEKSFFGKLEAFCWKFWDKEAVRFIFVGGINTVLGILVSIIIRYFFDENVWTAKYVLWIMEFDIPNIIAFIILLPVAYTMQALIAFKTKWTWKRLAVYPLTSIPNLFLQQVGIWFFGTYLGMNKNVAYMLGAIVVLPIMFFIIRFFVKPLKKKKTTQELEQKSY